MLERKATGLFGQAHVRFGFAPLPITMVLSLATAVVPVIYPNRESRVRVSRSFLAEKPPLDVFPGRVSDLSGLGSVLAMPQLLALGVGQRHAVLRLNQAIPEGLGQEDTLSGVQASDV